MTTNRRSFTRAASCEALLASVLSSVSHVATENRPPIPGSLGMLYNSTSYVDCQACVTKCRNINFLERSPQGGQTWSNSDKLSSYTNNTIQVWTSGTGADKDQEENGYAYIKRRCMHCVNSNCASVCPVSALKRDPKTGTVRYDKDVCIDYRYCMIACPYDVPEYDCDNPFGALHRCKLCNQRGVERLDKGGLPGCIEVYPVGTVTFGTREELMAEAKEHLALRPDSEYHYPHQMLKSGDTYLRTVPKYYPHLYGEREGGGTQVLVLTDMLYENLNLLKLGDPSTDVRSEHVQRTPYKGTMLSLAALAGLTVLVRHNTKNDHHDGGDDHES